MEILSERSKESEEQKKNRGSVLVAESAYNAQNAQFGLVMKYQQFKQHILETNPGPNRHLLETTTERNRSTLIKRTKWNRKEETIEKLDLVWILEVFTQRGIWPFLLAVWTIS